eukprot:358772-Chlamydomonas_euryale.AAC.18
MPPPSPRRRRRSRKDLCAPSLPALPQPRLPASAPLPHACKRRRGARDAAPTRSYSGIGIFGDSSGVQSHCISRPRRRLPALTPCHSPGTQGH